MSIMQHINGNRVHYDKVNASVNQKNCRRAVTMEHQQPSQRHSRAQFPIIIRGLLDAMKHEAKVYLRIVLWLAHAVLALQNNCA
jgi:hypothetical protein